MSRRFTSAAVILKPVVGNASRPDKQIKAKMISRKRINLSDILFLGWYHILDKTIYSYGNQNRGIGPKEHSFFITFLFHGINVWTVLRYILGKYFDLHLPLYLSLSLAILIFVIGFIVYFRNKRADRVIRHNLKNVSVAVFVFVSLIYVIATGYLMLETGNYLRYHFSK